MTEGLHYGVQLVERRVNKFSGFSAGDVVLSAENDRREDLAAETEKALDFLGRFSPGKRCGSLGYKNFSSRRYGDRTFAKPIAFADLTNR